MPLPDGSATNLEIGEQLMRLAVVFRAQVQPDDPKWAIMTREYVEALKRFPFRSLQAGIGRLIATQRDKYWPTPAHIVAAINDAVDEERAAKSQAVGPRKPAELRFWGEVELFGTDIGQEALIRGVGSDLHHHCVTRGLPIEDFSINAAIVGLAKGREGRDSLVPGHPGYEQLCNLWETMEQREADFRAKYLRGARAV